MLGDRHAMESLLPSHLADSIRQRLTDRLLSCINVHYTVDDLEQWDLDRLLAECQSKGLTAIPPSLPPTKTIN